MKNKVLGMLAGLFILAASATQTKAQVSLNVNIGTWNPPVEYADASYYYLPDVNSYYYVPTHQYVYLNGNNWVWRRSLPPRYQYYNINDGYKVAVYRPRPYRYYANDRVRYARYRGVRNVIVRDRYYHPRAIGRPAYAHDRPRAIGHTRVVTRTRVYNHPRAIGHQRTVVRQRTVVHQRAIGGGHSRNFGHQRAIGHQGGGHGHGRAIGHH